MENIRAPFLHQDSYFSITEQLWLRAAYERKEVQAALATEKAPVKEAGQVLQRLFKEENTSPGPGESEEDFEARKKRARKDDRARLSRKVETQAEFEERMQTLADVSLITCHVDNLLTTPTACLQVDWRLEGHRQACPSRGEQQVGRSANPSHSKAAEEARGRGVGCIPAQRRSPSLLYDSHA